MRIGIDTREMLDRPTGVGRYLAELLARWTRDPAWAAQELMLFSPRPPLASPPWEGVGGARVRHVPAPGGSGTRWEQTTLATAVRREAPDVFFAPGYTAPLRAGCPLVVAIHDVSFAAHPEWFRWREGLRRRLFSRWAARKATRVITISAFSRSEIASHLRVEPDKVVVTPLAVDAHPSLQGPGSGPPGEDQGGRTASAAPSGRHEHTERRTGPGGSRMVLYVGSILERRHLPELVAAFARATARVPAATLEIAGDNRTHPRVDPLAIARSLGVERLVHLHDYVDETRLAGLYGRARVFAFLSSYEGFGLPPLEAMRMDVPAVVLDTPVSREVYGDAALRVDLARPDTIDAALVSLLEDEDVRRRQGEASARVLARYSWDATARQTMEILIDAAR